MAGNNTQRKGTLRIIGGQWRGRKLAFTAIEGLRPTPDRVRETVFNWLAPHLPGARCMDLFAGSGALGMEALSRGAAECQFIDSSATACSNISRHIKTVAAIGASCQKCDALAFLDAGRQGKAAVQIAFLDPPFSKDLWQSACTALEEKQWLEAGSFIYLESAKRNAVPEVPDTWQLHRDQYAGDVRFQLFVRG